MWADQTSIEIKAKIFVLLAYKPFFPYKNYACHDISVAAQNCEMTIIFHTRAKYFSYFQLNCIQGLLPVII